VENTRALSHRREPAIQLYERNLKMQPGCMMVVLSLIRALIRLHKKVKMKKKKKSRKRKEIMMLGELQKKTILFQVSKITPLMYLVKAKYSSEEV
jgi:hypothetical protein